MSYITLNYITMKPFYLFLLLAHLCSVALAQEGIISGMVRYSGQGVEGATISLKPLQRKTLSGRDGAYSFSGVPLGVYILEVTAAGYLPFNFPVTLDSSGISTLTVELKVNASSLNEVVVTGSQRARTKLDSPIPVEVYTPTFFRKNPTPSIFEALGIVNGVQPQLNCNVCNTGDIHINGMEGPYTMVLIDGMPIVSSLATVYGLSGIPNSMVKRIEVVKGPASTIYGSEAVGGLINIITKDPDSSTRLFLDLSTTSLQEHSGDLAVSFQSGTARALVGVNGFWYDKIHDANKDGFTDVTQQKRVALFNKWLFTRKSGRMNSLALRYLHEARWGGQVNWEPKWRGTDSIYGESIVTDRVEAIGKYDLPVNREKIGLEYSYNYHHQDSYYGVVPFMASQHTAFAQLRWNKTIGRHDLFIGVPFRHINYDDNTPGTADRHGQNKKAKTYLPGIFIQDEYSAGKLTTLVGIRYDHHSEHGSIWSPRVSFKWAPHPKHVLRWSTGNGFRVVNLFTEDHAALTGARKVEIGESLKPEQSWNTNVNYTGLFQGKGMAIALDASVFYTYFTNKIVADYLTDPQLILYDNLHGHAISKGITLNTDVQLQNRVKLLVGITLMDVYEKNRDSLGISRKEPQLFAPKFSGTFAVSYSFPAPQLTIDLTGKVNGSMYLPVVPNDFRPAKSPLYGLINLQVSRKFSERMEIYTTVKNLLNFLPNDPILRPFDPFDRYIHTNNPLGYTFDPSYNYAPVQGIKVMAGCRFRLGAL
jgi:outer membrane receptor for ferrienterochelin and colicins